MRRTWSCPLGSRRPGGADLSERPDIGTGEIPQKGSESDAERVRSRLRGGRTRQAVERRVRRAGYRSAIATGQSWNGPFAHMFHLQRLRNPSALGALEREPALQQEELRVLEPDVVRGEIGQQEPLPAQQEAALQRVEAQEAHGRTQH